MISKRSIAAMTLTTLSVAGLLQSERNSFSFRTALLRPTHSLPHDETHPVDFLYRHLKEYTKATIPSSTTLNIDVFDTVIPTDFASAVTTP